MKLLPTFKTIKLLILGRESGPSSSLADAPAARKTGLDALVDQRHQRSASGPLEALRQQPIDVPGTFVEDVAPTPQVELSTGFEPPVQPLRLPVETLRYERQPFSVEPSESPPARRLAGLGGRMESWFRKEPEVPLVAGSEGAIVWAAGEWVATKPTDDHTKEFPSLSKFASTSVVPKALQKQPADRGTFFTPAIESKALGKTARFGLYLPPGFDPASDVKYPVLMLLPGKGGELNQWTSVGHLIPTLNTMMAGDNQKMVVVIADNTNSFWYDYDTNGSSTFGGDKKLRDPRNFEGHVMDELLGEVLSKYKGDENALTITGISRGGSGALQLASRHTDKFVSASSMSGLLMLEHGDNRLGGLAARDEIRQHFGGPSDPVWSNFTPYDLLRAGKLDASSTKLYVEVGADDKNMLPGTLDYLALAKARGVKVEHAVFGEHQKAESAEGEPAPSGVAHNWDFWGKTLPLHIAFHQRALGGKASKPKLDSSLTLRDNALLAEREVSRAERREAVVTGLAEARADLGKIVDYVTDRALPTPRPFEPGFVRALREHKADPSVLTEPLARFIDDTEAGLTELPLFAQEQRLAELQRAIADRSTDSKDLRYHLVGEPLGRISTKLDGINALPEGPRADVNALIGVIPEAQGALAQLANQYPELLSRVDPLTHHNGTFANQLLAFATHDLADKADRAGFVKFIERMAHGEWDWRRGGFSHTVNSATAIAFRHPGMVLDLIRAARARKYIEYQQPNPHHGGSRVLIPGDNSWGDLYAGFRPVDSVDDLPSGELGYERGFLRMVRDWLAPRSVPADRFGALCGPISVAMSKLLGKDYRYGYLHKIKDGADLVGAMQSQGEYGLSLAEAWVQIGDDPLVTHLHFPHFSDYDPVNGTVVMQEWERGRQLVKVDQLKFIGEAGPEKGPKPVSGYFLIGKGHEGIQKYWTREAEGAKPKPPPPSERSRSRRDDDDEWL